MTRAALVIVLVMCSPTLWAGPYYVVVASFSNDADAAAYANIVGSVFSESSSRFDPVQRLHHVYVMNSKRLNEATDFKAYVQERKGFGNAWVYTDISETGENHDDGEGAGPSYATLELYTGGVVLLGSEQNSYFTTRKESKNNTPSGDRLPLELMFSAQTVTGIPVEGKVLLLDKRGKAISSFQTGDVVSFGGIEWHSSLTLVLVSPGYSTETKIMDLGNFAETDDVALNDEGIWQVTFHIRRLEVDEASFLFDDLFAVNSAVSEPEGKEKFEALVRLLRAHPKLSVVINSHCNAGAKRAIAVPGRSGDPFDPLVIAQRSGTDKHLTRWRAEGLREYLVREGIAERRITVMGWGSMDPIVKRKGTNAALNERVTVALRGIGVME